MICCSAHLTSGRPLYLPRAGDRSRGGHQFVAQCLFRDQAGTRGHERAHWHTLPGSEPTTGFT